MAPKKRLAFLEDRRKKAHKPGEHNPAGPTAEQALAHAKVSIHTIAKALGKGDRGPSRHAVTSASHEFSKRETPYGQVTTAVSVPLKSGLTHDLYCNNPFALLSAACAVRPAFGEFLLRHLPTDGDHMATLSFYFDETTPGNQLRPDHGRSFYSIMWTIVDLPPWFISRVHGWFKFTYLPVDQLEEVKGGLPTVIKAMVYQFFSQVSFNFETSGLNVMTPTGEKHFQAEFGFFKIDERACKFATDVTGSSGLHVCCCCKNVMGAGFHPPPGDYFCHFSEHRRALWDPHDPASFLALKERLDDTYNNGGNLKDMQTLLGLNRNEDGLLWDDYVASIVKLPHSMYWDPMHCEYASGGNVQYLLNDFALVLTEHGFDLRDLDDFTRTCTKHSLSKKIWQTRVVHRKGAHIRAFASEVLEALGVLFLFCDAVVTPAGVMDDHVKAVKLARDVALILGDARNIMLNVDKLEELQASYQELAQKLCGTKPKNHYTRYIVDCINRWKKLFSCWAPERDHQRSKQIAIHQKKSKKSLRAQSWTA